MKQRCNDARISAAGQNLARFLIASYFIGVALRLIDGPHPGDLLAQLAPPEHQQLTIAAVSAAIFALAFMVLIGLWIRLSAIVLSVVILGYHGLFYAATGGEIAINQLWPHLAIVGALLQSYASGNRVIMRKRALFRSRVKVRRITPGPDQVQNERRTPLRVVHAGAPNVPASAPVARRQPIPPAPKPRENIFADDDPEMMLA